MMPAQQPGMVVTQSDQTAAAESAAGTLSARAQSITARQQERATVLAFIAKFEARLQQLNENPPLGASPLKIQAQRESIEDTLQDLRRKVSRRKPRLA